MYFWQSGIRDRYRGQGGGQGWTDTQIMEYARPLGWRGVCIGQPCAMIYALASICHHFRNQRRGFVGRGANFVPRMRVVPGLCPPPPTLKMHLIFGSPFSDYQMGIPGAREYSSLTPGTRPRCWDHGHNIRFTHTVLTYQTGPGSPRPQATGHGK